MILYINTCRDNAVVFAVFSENGKKKSIIFVNGIQRKNKILNHLEKFFRKSKVSPRGLTRIICVKGPGKFSSVRTGVAIANTLSHFLNVPIAEALDSGTPSNENGIWEFLKTKTKLGGKKRIIEPWYGKEPNITMRESRSKN